MAAMFASASPAAGRCHPAQPHRHAALYPCCSSAPQLPSSAAAPPLSLQWPGDDAVAGLWDLHRLPREKVGCSHGRGKGTGGRPTLACEAHSSAAAEGGARLGCAHSLQVCWRLLSSLPPHPFRPRWWNGSSSGGARTSSSSRRAAAAAAGGAAAPARRRHRHARTGMLSGGRSDACCI